MSIAGTSFSGKNLAAIVHIPDPISGTTTEAQRLGATGKADWADYERLKRQLASIAVPGSDLYDRGIREIVEGLRL